MKLTCAIIDDEPLAVELMKGYVRKTPFLELCGAFGSGTEAFGTLREHPVELLFCDIQMPGLNGMELTRMLPAETRVIFTTAFDSYAVEGFRVRAIDYLLKPISYADFLAAAQKALEWFEIKRRAEAAGRGDRQTVTPDDGHDTAPRRSELRSIFVKTEYRLQQIPLDGILYIEGLKDYVKIHLEGEPRPVLSLMSLKSLEEQLPADRFIRVHRSYIVQPAKIRTIERNRIVSSAGSTFPFRRATGRPSTTSSPGTRCCRRGIIPPRTRDRPGKGPQPSRERAIPVLRLQTARPQHKKTAARMRRSRYRQAGRAGNNAISSPSRRLRQPDAGSRRWAGAADSSARTAGRRCTATPCRASWPDSRSRRSESRIRG